MVEVALVDGAAATPANDDVTLPFEPGEAPGKRRLADLMAPAGQLRDQLAGGGAGLPIPQEFNDGIVDGIESVPGLNRLLHSILSKDTDFLSLISNHDRRE